MTRNQALQLQRDWGKDLESRDYSETLYLSIKGIGAKTFKNCCHHEHEGYIFIWTKEESFLVSKKELGDFVMVEDPQDSILSIKQNKVT